ncbi:ABC transporter substrate-binding protein [Caproiciproducens sp. NJN-50]|uniref:ABC transporter substrate-binding protein n=1 Tax=Caproiciproducens sp. NJN-50 TaxID=2507162 RepID=UPI000FFE250E|nr:ABC transporter substrate-binding protein [Caproiciproducens sp. NJN-50]QAT50065.1 ABC transporter substrate-binding protein [Caproiciproducens sp. NJN-50]
MKKGLQVLLSASLIIGLLAGCGSGAQTAPASSSAGGSSTASAGTKTIRIAAVDPQVPLDMQQNTYSIIMRLTDNVAESLISSQKDGSLAPLLLDQMPTLFEDKLTYSFTLKSVKFHDGTTLASSDVKYSLERLVKEEKMASLMAYVAGYDAMESGKATELSGIKVVDDTHFTITLSKPYSPFLSVLSTPYAAIYPKAACEAAGDTWGLKTLIGTGPFKLDSYTAGSGAEFSKFSDYHGGAPKIDKISYKFIEDPNTQVLEYQKGNVDFVDLDNSLYPVYSSNAALKDQIHSFQQAGGYYFNFNVKTIKDPKVREAISLAIDRKSICDSVLHGTASVPTSFIPASLTGHDSSAQAFAYDPAKAKSLLASAGYASGYNLRVTVNTKSNLGKSIATAFQQEAKAAGINVTVEPVDSAAWSDMKKNGGMDCSVSNWYVDYNDPDSMLYPVSDNRADLVSSFWHNAQFKQLMEDGVKTDDSAARQKIYVQAENILTRQDFAIAPLINETKFYLLNPKVTGFEINSDNRMDFSKADIG